MRHCKKCGSIISRSHRRTPDNCRNCKEPVPKVNRKQMKFKVAKVLGF